MTCPPIVFPPEQGEHAVYVLEVLDGDTVKVCFLVEQSVRVLGINAPEVHGPQRPQGLKTKARMAELLPAGSVVRAVLHGREKYGRLLAELVGPQGSASQVLLREGLAAPWDGLGARPLPAQADKSHPLLGEPE